MIPHQVKSIIESFPDPVQEFFDEMIKAKRSEGTIINYAYDYKQFFQFLDKHNIPFESVDGKILQRFFHKKKGKERKRSSLSSLFRFLTKKHFFERNPMIDYNYSRPRRKPKTPSEFLTKTEATNLIRAADGDTWIDKRNRAILFLLLSTGIKVSELVNLDHNHLKDDVLIIHGKKRKERRIKLNRTAIGVLYSYLESCPLGEDPDALFLNYMGRRITRKTVYEIVRRCANNAGIKKHVTPHTLRHTVGAILIENGSSIRSVQELLGLGHTSQKTIEEYYHVIDVEKEQALKTLKKLAYTN